MKEILSKEEARTQLSCLHDEIKNNQYWNTFNTGEFRGVYHNFMKMENVFFQSSFLNHIDFIYFENPIAPLIVGSVHTVNRMMGCLLSGDSPSDYIITIQGFLSLFHCLIDECEHTSICVAYRSRKNNQTKYLTMVPIQK